LLGRLAVVGRNELAAAPRKSLWAMVVEQFEDRLVQILLAVAVVSAVLSVFEDDPSAFVEPLVILAILVLNALVGIWQGQSAEGALDALKKVGVDG
jgi:magnesium-transporting ATPase (P-type)